VDKIASRLKELILQVIEKKKAELIELEILQQDGIYVIVK